MKLVGFTEKGLESFLKALNAKGIKREDLVGIYPGLNSRFHAVYWQEAGTVIQAKKRGRPAKSESVPVDSDTTEIDENEFI